MVKQEIEALEAENNTLQEELATLKGTANTIPDLQKDRSQLQSDLSKFDALNAKLCKHIEVHHCERRIYAFVDC